MTHKAKSLRRKIMAKRELPKGWEWKKIGELVEISYGKGLPKSRRLNEGTVPVYGSNGRVGYHGSAVTNGPTIIIGRKGSIGEVHLSSQPCWPIDTTYFLDDFPETLSVDYLYYFLKSLDLSQLNRAAAIPGIRRDDIYSVEIPLPPLEEQRRIVARIEELLSRIKQAKSLRQKSLAETSAVMPAALYHIFSKAGEDAWEKRPIKELIDDMRTGTTPPSKEEKYYGGDIEWLTPGDLGEHKYLVKSARMITHTAIEEGKAKIFKKDTILFVGIGATLGKVGIAGDNVSSNQQITGMLFKDAVVPDFAYYWFRHNYDYIRALSPAATLPIINQDGLGSLVMEYPSVDEQRCIVAYLDGLREKINELKRLESETGKEIEQITQSILTSAFRGEL